MIGTVLAWGLPLAFGLGLWAATQGLPRGAAAWIAALGGGFVLGNLAVGVLLGVLHPAVLTHAFALVATALALFTAAVWIWVWRRGSAGSPPLPDRVPSSAAARWLVAAMLLLLAARAVLLVDEIWLRPLFPWDAWWVWSARAKAWLSGGHFDAVVAPAQWLAQGDALLRTGTAWNYPPLLAWIELWYGLGAGGWIDPLVNLPWFGLWLALLALCYGQWRQLGAPRTVAASGVYALGSLPLLNVHVALAGYADLWLAAALALAALAWLRARQGGGRGAWGLAIGLLISLPLLKFEGVVWAVCLGVPMAYAAVPPRHRRWGLLGIAGAAVVLVGVSVGLDLAWVRLARDLLTGASGGRTATSSLAVLRALADGLFLQYNWHLFWFVFAGLLAWRWRILWRQHALRHLAAVLLLALGFVVVLFLFTPAAKWAESYTAVNRLMLQLVPLATSLGVLLLRDWGSAVGDSARGVPSSDAEVTSLREPAPGDTAPAAPASSAPA